MTRQYFVGAKRDTKWVYDEEVQSTGYKAAARKYFAEDHNRRGQDDIVRVENGTKFAAKSKYFRWTSGDVYEVSFRGFHQVAAEMTDQTIRSHRIPVFPSDTRDLFCNRCDEPLKPELAVWLELNTNTGIYHSEGQFPKDGLSQGCFEFGATCAKKIANRESA